MFGEKAFTRAMGFIVAVFLEITPTSANIKLPRLVGDNMVLQRDSRLLFWGAADPGEKVTIEFHRQKVSTRTDEHGAWSVSMGPFASGGPFELLLKGKNSVRVKNILVGDVWLASGQSNMEFPVKAGGEDWMTGVIDAEAEMAEANFPRIRLFMVRRDAALTPQFDVDSEGWRAVTPETVSSFSAVAYLFGRELHERYQIPIGLIEATWGGTMAEAWMSTSALQPFPEFHQQIDAIGHVDAKTRRAYEQYMQRRSEWDRSHRTQDYGRDNGHDLWADPTYDARAWPTIVEPRPYSASGKDFNGFNGVVWFRRVLRLSPDQAGKKLHLYLGTVAKDDVVYFNGAKIGETQGIRDRDYVVPGNYVKSGENVIVVRIVGLDDPKDPGQSAVGMFGVEDQMHADVGSSQVSLAGTWSYQPGADLRDFPVADEAVLAARPSEGSPTELFNGMVNPLIRFRIKGVIWYQGEANALDNRSVQYRGLFPALIEDWRQQWRYQMPFLFVQLAGFGPDQPESVECQWAELREAQAMALALPRTGMATAVDIGDTQDIHPRNKQDVSHRLVLSAAKVAYGEDIIDSGPTYQSMQVQGDRIRIRFRNLGTGLRVKNRYGYVRGFEIAADDGEYVWAQARRDGSDVLVFSDSIQHPVAVRYDWSNTPDGNLYNAEGLPATPFRTDAPKSLHASR
jgi:sialate O-acetylesterase